MPARVHVASRIRADSGSLGESGAEALAAALTAATKRALARSRREVLEVMDGRPSVRFHEPTLSWTGEQAMAVGPLARWAIEQAIRRGLAAAVDQAGFVAAHSDARGVRGPAEEGFDPARYDPLRRAYLIDSYGGGVAPVSVMSFEPLVVGDYVEVAKLVDAAAIDEEIRGQIEALMEDATPDRPLGVIYRLRSGGDPWNWQVVITDGGPKLSSFWFPPSSFSRWRFMGQRAKPMFVRETKTPSPGPGSAEVVIRAPDAEAFKAQFLELMKAETADVIAALPAPVNLTTRRFHELLHANMEQALGAQLAAMSAPTVGIRVKLGAAHAIVCMDAADAADLTWRGKAELTPVIAYEPRKKSTARGGGSGERSKTTGSLDGTPGGCGLCPPDIRPDDHPPDDVEESLEDLPFLGEPSLDEIGDTGEALKERIAKLAALLNIPTGSYAGQFCYHAAVALRDAAIQTQDMDEAMLGESAASSSAGKGNLGVLDFKPGGSAVIVRVRELAGILHEVGAFVDYIGGSFETQTLGCTIHGIWRGRGVSWTLRFWEAVIPVLKEAVGELFIGACRSMLLQLLGTSLDEIEKRRAAMPRYALLFERWILPLIVDMAELETLRRLLRNHSIAAAVAPVVISGMAGQAWVAATKSLVTTLKGDPFTQSPGEAYAFVTDGGVEKIRDRKGRLWSSEDLEQALALQGAIAEGADPLVKQMVDTPEAKERFKEADSVQSELVRLLDDMVANNLEMTVKAIGDARFAFSTGQIDEDIPTASVPGGKYPLQGIHKIAHEQIGDAFKGSSLYPAGLDDLFDSELGKRSLKGAAILTGMVLLCVLVPGGGLIAFAAGVALATNEIADAYEKKRLYGALINPELVVTHADVEATLFAAYVGLALSLIPESGTAVKGLLAGGKAVIKGEGRALGNMAGKAIATRLAKEFAEYAVRDILTALLKEATMNVIINLVIEQAMKPLIAYIQKEDSIGLGGASGPKVLPAATDQDGQDNFIKMIIAQETL